MCWFKRGKVFPCVGGCRWRNYIEVAPTRVPQPQRGISTTQAVGKLLIGVLGAHSACVGVEHHGRDAEFLLPLLHLGGVIGKLGFEDGFAQGEKVDVDQWLVGVIRRIDHHVDGGEERVKADLLAIGIDFEIVVAIAQCRDCLAREGVEHLETATMKDAERAQGFEIDSLGELRFLGR